MNEQIREILKESYDFELHRKELLSSKSTTPLTIFGILGGIFVYLLNALSMTENEYSAFVVLSLTFFGATLISAIYFMWRSLLGQQYIVLPRGDELYEWHAELKTHFGTDEQAIENFFSTGIILRLQEATKVNAYKNDIIDSYIHRSNQSLLIASVFAIITAAPIYSNLLG